MAATELQRVFRLILGGSDVSDTDMQWFASFLVSLAPLDRRISLPADFVDDSAAN